MSDVRNSYNMEKKGFSLFLFFFFFFFFFLGGGVGGFPIRTNTAVGREKKSGWKRLKQNMNFHHNLIKLIQTATLLSASDE